MSLRTPGILVLFAMLSAWASAQGPTASGLSAGEQLKLLTRNRLLLDDLLERGLSVTEANSPLTRLEECRRTADRLGEELRGAVTRSDADRVSEIGDHIHAIVNDGLLPNLREARDQIRPGSADYGKLQELHGLASQKLNELPSAVPTTGEFAQQRRVRETREKLAASIQAIGKPEGK